MQIEQVSSVPSKIMGTCSSCCVGACCCGCGCGSAPVSSVSLRGVLMVDSTRDSSKVLVPSKSEGCSSLVAVWANLLSLACCAKVAACRTGFKLLCDSPSCVGTASCEAGTALLEKAVLMGWLCLSTWGLKVLASLSLSLSLSLVVVLRAWWKPSC